MTGFARVLEIETEERECLRARVAEAAKDVLVKFDEELTDQQRKFIVDQIARRVVGQSVTER